MSEHEIPDGFAEHMGVFYKKEVTCARCDKTTYMTNPFEDYPGIELKIIKRHGSAFPEGTFHICNECILEVLLRN